MTACLLKEAGRTVALLEREHFASIDTAHTTAHLTNVTDLRLTDIERSFGREAARAVWDAGGAGLDQIVRLIRQHDIECDFHWVQGYLHAPVNHPDEGARRRLQAEAELARELGIEAEFLDDVPGPHAAGIRFPHQAVFHPLKFLAALLPRIPGDGSYVFENSPAEEFGEEFAVRSGGHTVYAPWVVMATHTPLTGVQPLLKATLFQTKLALYTSYVLGARLPAGRLPEGSWWDTDNPYHYLRVERRGTHDYAIYGGEDHKTGQETDPAARYQNLEASLRSIAPEAEVDHHWSGQVIETNDGLPFIGEFRPKQFGGTGYAGNGMTFGALAAFMAVDAVLDRPNPWQDLFDPHRKKLRGGTWSYLKENKDFPYYLVRDRLARTESGDASTLAPGEGALLKIDGQRVAAYRAPDGKLSLCSPVCTHLQCIVNWNVSECTWDCPCHGSRFHPTGEVLSGPAEEPLRKLPASED